MNRTDQQNAHRGSEAVAERKPIPIKLIIVGVALLALVILGVKLCTSAMPINVTVNGAQIEIRGAKTLQVAVRESGLPINPGDLISLRGNILQKNEGQPLTAYVNGEKTFDPDMRLRDGDVIEVTDGEDIVEDYTETTEGVPFSTSVMGVGAVHVFESLGSEGTLATRTGEQSGEVIQKQTVDPENAVYQRYNIDTGGEKVIALTFDDGPSEEYTALILDILAENDAKATFFVVGTSVEEETGGEDLVRREYAEGHQVCSHSYDHAAKSDTLSLTDLTTEEVIEEFDHGRQVITDAIGEEASYVVRFPGGDCDEDTLTALAPHIHAEIGWNLDTGDWREPGVDHIVDALMMSEGGDIILMHDGGGDRSQTVEALRIALPKLAAQGFRFITIDEMLEYPAKSPMD